MAAPWITLAEGITIGLMIYMPGQTLLPMSGPERSSLLGGVALAVPAPAPIVALICGLRSAASPSSSLEAMVAFWAVLAVASAVVGLSASRSASSS